MHRERLLGHMDIDTREWTDGVLTDAARKVVREPSDVSCWIICDGDVDPEVRVLLNTVIILLYLSLFFSLFPCQTCSLTIIVAVMRTTIFTLSYSDLLPTPPDSDPPSLSPFSLSPSLHPSLPHPLQWIESLNSVLDDNHLLTLPNGERIAFGPNVNFLFETHDLRFASPATVSRMGKYSLNEQYLDLIRQQFNLLLLH